MQPHLQISVQPHIALCTTRHLLSLQQLTLGFMQHALGPMEMLEMLSSWHWRLCSQEHCWLFIDTA